MQQKKIPLRRCVGCNAQKPKRELIRVVCSSRPDGELSIDLTGKKAGRGAYLCPSAKCLAKAKKTHRLEQTFSTEVSDELYASLTEQIMAAEQLAKEAKPDGE